MRTSPAETPNGSVSLSSSLSMFHPQTAASSADPNRRGALLDQGGQGPEPPLPSGPSRALPAHFGGNPSSELQASAVGLRSGLRLLRKGK